MATADNTEKARHPPAIVDSNIGGQARFMIGFRYWKIIKNT